MKRAPGTPEDLKGTHLPSMMVMMSLSWMWSLSGSSKSSSAHMSVGMVWRRHQGWNKAQQVALNAKF